MLKGLKYVSLYAKGYRQVDPSITGEGMNTHSFAIERASVYWTHRS